VNGTYFRCKLRPPSIELSDTTARLGQWSPEARVLSISRELATTQPWGVVLEVLKHEMAHQFVHEVLGMTGETSHGPAFRELCAKLGIDASASGVPAGNSAATSDGEARILERIARLLALAESANEHEAQAAMSAAQRLMLKYNLDAVAEKRTVGYGFRHVGTPSGRVSESERILGNILGEHFFVEVIWVPVYRPLERKRGSVLEICGTPANLEMASYVHAFLSHSAEQLWRAHKRAQKIRGNRDRRTYLAGVMTGFHEKLNAQRRENKEQGLVWVRDADLGSYYRRRHPLIQRTRYAGNPRTEAHAHGREAGRKLVLHRPVEGRSSDVVRLLPGKGSR
jgi:hypothetical protein